MNGISPDLTPLDFIFIYLEISPISHNDSGGKSQPNTVCTLCVHFDEMRIGTQKAICHWWCPHRGQGMGS